MLKEAIVIITIMTGEQSPVERIHEMSTVEACEQQTENIRQAIDETLPDPYKIESIRCEANV